MTHGTPELYQVELWNFIAVRRRPVDFANRNKEERAALESAAVWH
jgi:hypothetical protein